MRERRDDARRHARLAEYFDAAVGLDTATYVAAPGKRRLFVQHRRGDTTVSVAEGWAMFQVAAEPKRWKEYRNLTGPRERGRARSPAPIDGLDRGVQRAKIVDKPMGSPG